MQANEPLTFAQVGIIHSTFPTVWMFGSGFQPIVLHFQG